MIAFYVDVLGCRFERAQAELGLTQLRAGRSLIDLVSVDGVLGRAGGAAPGAEGHNLDHLCLRIETYDETTIRAHLTAHGVEIGEAGSRYGAAGRDPRARRAAAIVWRGGAAKARLLIARPYQSPPGQGSGTRRICGTPRARLAFYVTAEGAGDGRH